MDPDLDTLNRLLASGGKTDRLKVAVQVVQKWRRGELPETQEEAEEWLQRLESARREHLIRGRSLELLQGILMARMAEGGRSVRSMSRVIARPPTTTHGVLARGRVALHRLTKDR